MLVTIEVAEGREDDYRAWHDAHIVEVVTHVPSVTQAQRFELADVAKLAESFPTARFIAAYTLTGSPEQFGSELAAARAQGLISPPPDGAVSAALTLGYDSASDPVRS